MDALQERKDPDSCFPPGESIDDEDGKSGRVGELRTGSKDAKVIVREKDKDLGLERSSRVEHVSNGGVVQEYLKDDLLHEECSQRNEEYHVESFMRDKRTEMLAEDGRKKHRGLSSSPSQDTHHGHTRSGSSFRSPDRSRGRSRSRSVFREGSLPDTPKAHDDDHRTKRMHRSDSDGEHMIERNRDYRHATKDLPRDKEREHSTYSRHSRADRHHSRETWDRDREGSRDLDRDRTRERDRDRARAQERERYRDRERERERERDRDRVRERERHRNWEREERERRRERDRGGSRDRYRDREGEEHFRNSKYNDDGALNRHDDYRRRRYDEFGDKDRLRESAAEKTDSFKATLSEREIEKSRRSFAAKLL